MREKMLLKLAQWHANHPLRMLVVVFILSLFFGYFAEHLEQTMRWADLLPAKDHRTIEFNKIVDEFVTTSNIIIVVQGEEERIKAFADELAPRIIQVQDQIQNKKRNAQASKLKEKIKKLSENKKKEEKANKLRTQAKELEVMNRQQLFQRVDYKTEIEFLRDYGLLLIKEDDLKNMKHVYEDPNLPALFKNINDSLEKEYVGQEESISTRMKEDQAVMFLDSLQGLTLLMNKFTDGEKVPIEEIQACSDHLLFGESYMLSYDKDTLIMVAIPNFSLVDLDLCVSGTDAVQKEVDLLLMKYDGIHAGLSGFIAICRDEMVYSEQSLGITSLIAFIAIFALLIISFRMILAPVFAMLNLLIGLVWAIGTAAIIVGQLNIMTMMSSVILLGLGIDFSIHIITGFTERRAAGDPIQTSLEKTFLKSGKGILTGGLTTACAFLTLSISSSRGMKEMGLVSGTGLLAILLATFLFLPLLLVFRERRLDKKREKTEKNLIPRDISFQVLGKTALWISKKYIFSLIAGFLLTIFLFLSAANIGFDHNYLNIEPKGIASVELHNTIHDEFDMSMDYAMIVAESLSESRTLSDKFKELSTVAFTEDISIYLPSPAQQERRIPYIRDITKTMSQAEVKQRLVRSDMTEMINELNRLQMNIMEIQDMAYLGGQDKVDNKCKKIVGDPANPASTSLIDALIQNLQKDIDTSTDKLSFLQKEFAPYYKQTVLRMSSINPLEIQDLPLSILDRYSNNFRTQFLITAIPSGNCWEDALFLKRFVRDLESVDDRATGMPPVFRALIEIIGRDGRNAALLTLTLVFFLLWIDFKKPLYALMAMIPLIFGAAWMVGIMHLTGMKLTVMNVMALPLIIGIGIDDGVHVIHRWLKEGRGRIQTVFASTGKAILLTSLTTMIAFGSLVFSIWRGFGHLGGALFIGVGACFLTSVFILSGLLGFIERNKNKTGTETKNKN